MRWIISLSLCCTLWFYSWQDACAKSRRVLSGRVNLNTATLEQLTLLPKIGLRTARRILRYRKRRPFRSIREIRRVRGIGYKTYRRLRPYLTVHQKTDITVQNGPIAKTQRCTCPKTKASPKPSAAPPKARR
ncbi:MAG: DUF655 domain-containing protein [Myxococcota bacterium]